MMASTDMKAGPELIVKKGLKSYHNFYILKYLNICPLCCCRFIICFFCCVEWLKQLTFFIYVIHGLGLGSHSLVVIVKHVLLGPCNKPKPFTVRILVFWLFLWFVLPCVMSFWFILPSLCFGIVVLGFNVFPVSFLMSPFQLFTPVVTPQSA